MAQGGPRTMNGLALTTWSWFMQPSQIALTPGFLVGFLFPLFGLIAVQRQMGRKESMEMLCVWAVLLASAYCVALYYYPLQQDVGLPMDFVLVTLASGAAVIVGALVYLLLFVILVICYVCWQIAQRQRAKFRR
ncbi:MAG: hypothetical protein NUV59_02715 [Patescibacteria group bacterium]|nr:hypothetical protein [Patescibacteria group bacterium]